MKGKHPKNDFSNGSSSVSCFMNPFHPGMLGRSTHSPYSHNEYETDGKFASETARMLPTILNFYCFQAPMVPKLPTPFANCINSNDYILWSEAIAYLGVIKWIRRMAWKVLCLSYVWVFISVLSKTNDEWLSVLIRMWAHYSWNFKRHCFVVRRATSER